MDIVFSQKAYKKHPLFAQVSELIFNEEANDMPITSTGDCYIVFVYGTFTLSRKGEDTIAPKYYITPVDKAYRLSAEKGSRFIALRLNPDRFKVITGFDALDYMDQLVNLNTVLPESLCEELWLELKERAFSSYKKIIDNHLKKYFDDWSKPSVFTEMINYIHDKKGMLDVDHILDKFNYSHSTLNRHFKIFVGYTANKFIRLIRFNYIIRELQSNTEEVKSVIQGYKYYDYSHFVKDFKTFTGQTPKQFHGFNHKLVKEILFKKVKYKKQNNKKVTS